MKKKLIIDTDCGIDDAIAILMALADPTYEVVAITCVSGNVALNKVLRNVAIVLDAAGAGAIPIYAGASRPLIGPHVHAGEIHGKDGLGDVGFPPSARAIEQETAALAIIRIAREHPGTTLIALGPLTNVALALALEPELSNLLGGMVLMGGAVHAVGNATPVAEFNIYADAEAAAMTFERGLNPTVLTWEVTLATPVLWAEWDRLLSVGTIGSQFVHPITAESASQERERAQAGTLMPDPLAMAALLDPGCATANSATIMIDTNHGLTHGMTILDREGLTGRAHNAQVVSRVDPVRFSRLLERAFQVACQITPPSAT